MKYVELDILMTNGSRQKIAPIWDQYVDDKIIQVEDYEDKFIFNKSKVAKATFRLKDDEEMYALYS